MRSVHHYWRDSDSVEWAEVEMSTVRERRADDGTQSDQRQTAQGTGEAEAQKTTPAGREEEEGDSGDSMCVMVSHMACAPSGRAVCHTHSCDSDGGRSISARMADAAPDCHQKCDHDSNDPDAAMSVRLMARVDHHLTGLQAARACDGFVDC